MSNSEFDVPVVLLIFNRADTTQVVFDVIRQLQPKQLFVVADGPRKEKENEDHLCQAARNIIERVDWNCQVFKNYAASNLGCKARVSSGLNWVFEQVEEAIILEDDCVPELSFFQFCQELLKYYRHDTRIMAISGDNFQFGRKRSKYSYYFSRYPHCWGWATWKRAWKHYDVNMHLWPEVRDDKWLENILDNSKEERHRRKIFQKVYDNQLDSWAYGWELACWLQNGLTVLPQNNLVSNIGFSIQGTHTKFAKSDFSNMQTSHMKFPLLHPPFVIRNAEADKFTLQIMYGLTSRLIRKVINLIRF
ncbi:MAG: glycosyltransferase family 2 protein [Thainema sp.]